jgi:hypothetical protein
MGSIRPSKDFLTGANVMDFTRNPEEFPVYISKIKRDWTYASSTFLGLVDNWQEISKAYFADLVDVKLAQEENCIEGKMLDKIFSIKLSLLAVGQAGYAEAVLLTQQIGSGKVEIGRFRIHRDGNILDVDGTTLIDSGDRFYSYKIFTSVLHTVLEAPATVSS